MRPRARLLPCRGPCGWSGFTLIELLVVVAVIAILASLVMPVVLNSMRKATAANCTSNLKQLGATMIVYGKEHSMLIVTCRNDFTRSGTNDPIYWHHTLEPYVGDRGVFSCPAKEYASVGYGENYRVLGGINSGLSLWHAYQSMDMVRNPSGAVIFCDTAYIINRDVQPHDWIEHRSAVLRGYCRARIESYTAYDSDPWRAVGRHPAHKANCLFFDSRVDPIDIAELYAPMYGEPECLMDNQ